MKKNKKKIRGIAPDQVEEYSAYKKDIRRKINTILEKHWDPIGVYRNFLENDLPCEHHEYENYVQTLTWMVESRMSRCQIAKMLSFFAEELMGCGLYYKTHLSAADKLISTFYVFPYKE